MFFWNIKSLNTYTWNDLLILFRYGPADGQVASQLIEIDFTASGLLTPSHTCHTYSLGPPHLGRISAASRLYLAHVDVTAFAWSTHVCMRARSKSGEEIFFPLGSGAAAARAAAAAAALLGLLLM